ncbi:hypothetical protein CATMQ487_29500 [Sphaerotilus microaerophilus]|uniref:Type I restriction modification DNA specificity domain-containing protein n=1 Tax=Sphaerotilus microaerophilus TaxID=2914710 RepID=A0ABN6PQ31_9BURK|nr:hypothetical protein CATMQ487_29500 [Sphaerotilus sp. FB-5]
MGRLQIPYAPETEQRAIAAALSDIDALLSGLDRLIAKKRALKQAAMQQLLTGKTRLPGFEGEWEVRRLGELSEVRGGLAKNVSVAIQDPVSVAYLRVANVQDGHVDLSDVSFISIPRQELRRYSLRAGDVLMNEGGDLDQLGRGAVWRGQIDPCIHQNHVFAVRCGDSLLPDYLNAWTSGVQARQYFMLAGKQTTNLASISKSSLGELPVALPSVAEQQAIAAVLADMDAELEALEARREKTQVLKQGMMQELLTGRTRLV